PPSARRANRYPQPACPASSGPATLMGSRRQLAGAGEETTMDKTTVAQARRVEAIGRQVRLEGWVRTRRDSKAGFSFIELNDGSCQGNVQVVAPGELPNYEGQVKHLHTGASVVIEGEVKASPAKGQPTEVVAAR